MTPSPIQPERFFVKSNRFNGQKEQQNKDLSSPLSSSNRNEKALDLKGLKCPLPVLRIQKALTSLSPGDRLTAEITDPAATIDVPHFCQESGHKLINTTQKNGCLIFTLEHAGPPKRKETT